MIKKYWIGEDVIGYALKEDIDLFEILERVEAAEKEAILEDFKDGVDYDDIVSDVVNRRLKDYIINNNSNLRDIDNYLEDKTDDDEFFKDIVEPTSVKWMFKKYKNYRIDSGLFLDGEDVKSLSLEFDMYYREVGGKLEFAFVLLEIYEEDDIDDRSLFFNSGSLKKDMIDRALKGYTLVGYDLDLDIKRYIDNTTIKYIDLVDSCYDDDSFKYLLYKAFNLAIGDFYTDREFIERID